MRTGDFRIYSQGHIPLRMSLSASWLSLLLFRLVWTLGRTIGGGVARFCCGCLQSLLQIHLLLLWMIVVLGRCHEPRVTRFRSSSTRKSASERFHLARATVTIPQEVMEKNKKIQQDKKTAYDIKVAEVRLRFQHEPKGAFPFKVYLMVGAAGKNANPAARRRLHAAVSTPQMHLDTLKSQCAFLVERDLFRRRTLILGRRPGHRHALWMSSSGSRNQGSVQLWWKIAVPGCRIGFRVYLLLSASRQRRRWLKLTSDCPSELRHEVPPAWCSPRC